MSTCIHVYSEHRKDAEWVADEKATYNENVPTKHGWINATMKRTPCAEKYPFYELLVSGQEASELKYYLRQLIRDVPRNAEDLEDIRIVLWFDS